MTVIENAERRLQEEIRQHELGADNRYDLHYWAAYLDGARAQKKEGGELAMSALNYVERQGFMTGMDYAGMTAEERETLLKELRNLHVGPVEPLVAVHDYTKLVEALRGCKDIEFCTECPRMGNGFTEYCNIKEDAADAIEALQAEVERKRTADCFGCKCEKLEPKRGKWVREMNVYDEPFYHCSACGECFDSNRDDTHGIFNYCPNCGAKMEVQDESAGSL